VLEGYDNVRGPGGQTVFQDGKTSRIIYHYYDADVRGEIKFALGTLEWGQDGWPKLR
jgi:hypothetical protein